MRAPLLAGETVLDALARTSPDVTASFPASGERITARDLDEAATGFACALLAEGVGPGDVVGVLVPTTALFLVALFGVQRAGAAVSVLPTPISLGTGSSPARRIAAMADTAAMTHVVVDPVYDDTATALRRLRPNLTVVPPGLSLPGGARRLPAVTPDDLAIVQFTSGSTSAPKGVMLPHRTVVAGLAACVHSGRFSPDDVFVQWVPTFHDMGLIGLLSHLLNGADVHAFPPSTFVRRPRKVLRYFAERGGTVLTGPNFSYDHLLSAVDKEFLSALDLSSWRLAFNGAEPVRAETVRRFADELAVAGVRDNVMYPAYGMAEATLSITFPEPGSVPRILGVDRRALAEGRIVPGGKELVALGSPVFGMSVRIVDDAGAEAGEDRLGEIQISGTPVTTGYYDDPEATAAVFDGRWLRTGDLGFWHDGLLYIGGRAKEVMILRGQNHFPEDVEAVARQVPGVYRRRCVAFADDGDGDGEHIAVVVERDSRGPGAEEIAAEVARRVAAELDLTRIRVHVVRPNWLPRTTSGKWQRGAARERLADTSARGQA
jgi:fatty-acyl-CoA synthase